MHIANPVPNGVTVAQLILVQFVEVRILIGQPFFPFFFCFRVSFLKIFFAVYFSLKRFLRFCAYTNSDLLSFILIA